MCPCVKYKTMAHFKNKKKKTSEKKHLSFSLVTYEPEQAVKPTQFPLTVVRFYLLPD